MSPLSNTFSLCLCFLAYYPPTMSVRAWLCAGWKGICSRVFVLPLCYSCYEPQRIKWSLFSFSAILEASATPPLRCVCSRLKSPSFNLSSHANHPSPLTTSSPFFCADSKAQTKPPCDLSRCILGWCSDNSWGARVQAASPSRVLCQESRLHPRAQPIPVQIKLLSRRAWGGWVCIWLRAGRTAGCWKGPLLRHMLFWCPSTLCGSKAAQHHMCAAEARHLRGVPRHPQLRGAAGAGAGWGQKEPPGAAPISLPPAWVGVPGPWWWKTLDPCMHSPRPLPTARPTDFWEILQTDRQQQEHPLLPTATWSVPQRRQTEATCWHRLRGGKASFWSTWGSHLGKKWVLLESWGNGC